MGYFFNFKNNLVEVMGEYYKDKNIIISHEFTSDRRNYPLKESMVCVGYKEISSIHKSSGYLGESKEGEVFGTTALLGVRLDIYVPVKSGGSAAYGIFSSLSDFFILNSGRFSASSIKSGEVRFDSLLEAFHLVANAEIRTSVKYYQDQLGVIKNIILN